MQASRFNNFFLGLVLGFIAPSITLLVVYLLQFNKYSIGEFIAYMQILNITSKVISLVMLSNLLLFFVFIWTNLMNSSKGVLAATIVLAFVSLIIKYTF